MRSLIILLAAAALLFTVSAQESTAPRTGSYGLFPIEGSAVHGTLQLTEDFAEGGLRAIVTLTGINQGQLYLPVLFRGTCGPDREMVAQLPAVGSFSNDPFVSISHFDVSFDEIAGNQFFMYLFPGDTLPPEKVGGTVESNTAVACGQVGLGANR